MDQIDHLRIKRRGSSRNGVVERWRSGEGTCLPPMWPGFDSEIRRHLWVEFGGSLLCTSISLALLIVKLIGLSRYRTQSRFPDNVYDIKLS